MEPLAPLREKCAVSPSQRHRAFSFSSISWARFSICARRSARGRPVVARDPNDRHWRRLAIERYFELIAKPIFSVTCQ